MIEETGEERKKKKGKKEASLLNEKRSTLRKTFFLSSFPRDGKKENEKKKGVNLIKKAQFF